MGVAEPSRMPFPPPTPLLAKHPKTATDDRKFGHAIIQNRPEGLMEFEQIGKRLEWLDEQQRQSKSSVGDLGSRLAALETSINALTQQFKTLSKELTEVSPISGRIDQFEEMLTKQRAELGKIIDSVDKAAIRREQDIQKMYLTELEEIRKSIFQVSNSVNTDEIYKKLKDR